jgi:hypothetical protein
MNKNVLKQTGLALLLTATLFSCKKAMENAAESEVTEQIAEVQAKSEYIDQEASDVVNESAAKIGAFSNGCNPNFANWATGCATVTASGSFPAKTITVDFGTGCTNNKGITRKGIISILLTDYVQNAGSVATITFNNYFVNGFQRGGTIVRTNNTVAGGNPMFNRTVTNGSLTSPAGLVRTFSSNINIEQTAGSATPCDVSDDIHLLTGTRSVTGFNGKSRTISTQTPLQKKGNCSNIDQGILNITNTTSGVTATLDFGNGNCDNQAILSIPGRNPKTITLK